MKKSNILERASLARHYIITTPTRIEDLADVDEDLDYTWLQKSRRLQARRWRKIKHQIV